MCARPSVGEDLVDAIHRPAGGELPEHVGDVRDRIDSLHSAGGENGERDSGALGALIRTGEHPVFAADGHAAELALDEPVIDLESAVVEEAREHVPIAD